MGTATYFLQGQYLSARGKMKISMASPDFSGYGLFGKEF
jgi:hypothetical protein